MDKPPQAYRSTDDESLFKKPTDDPSIKPDRVSPGVEGYFRIPAVWVGEEPDPDSVSILNPDIHHAVVFKTILNCGIEVRVQRDGTFLFDFSYWPLAPLVIIPGYRIPDPGNPHRIPLETSNAEDEAENYAVFRAQVMNVHQVCLTTSEKTVKRRSAAMGLPVTSWNTLKALTFDTVFSYRDDIEDIRALGRNVLNNKDRVQRIQPFPRRILEKEVIEHSFKLLDQILSLEDANLIQWIEAAYIAACRCAEKRYGEAVVLAWTVCEQLLSLAWDTLQKDIKVSNRMTRKRKKKLEGRDYTTSVIIEFLETNNRLDYDLYKLLEDVRKSRNDWAHRMCVPEEDDATKAVRAVEGLFWNVKEIRLSLSSGARGGVPKWSIWVWDQVRKNS
ncbi:MAG: hypothetical protein OXI02_06710 [Candidatus Dadabacteria bacterium]|nr:hypothetical protein [Candidatus Dadabacteria bacterium]MDE0477732.1 hypothetical protein [Candidatus Dadabacteria bacterium]